MFFDKILKINLTLPIGRIATPVALIDNCVADEMILKPQLKIVDYGGNNQKDSNISRLPYLAYDQFN